jgi:predicted lactoylglutathione lyase
MAGNPIHITLVTLGVADVQASAAFYETLGLFGREPLAEDAGVPSHGEGFRAVTLAWNQPDEDAVDDALARAVKAGGQLVKAAEKVFWDGYSGYFSDPDGHLWDVAYNPYSPLREDGSMEL